MGGSLFFQWVAEFSHFSQIINFYYKSNQNSISIVHLPDFDFDDK
jgi:hypothetical protein